MNLAVIVGNFLLNKIAVSPILSSINFTILIASEVPLMNVKQLIETALKNNQRSYYHLFDLHWDYVYGYLLKKTQQPQLAEELAVRCFSNAFDKMEQFDPSARFATWLISIAQNLWIDQQRQTQTKKSQLTDVMAEVPDFERVNLSPEEEMIANQKLDKLLEHIQSLNSDYRKLIQLRYFEGYSYNQIASHLKQPLSTIKVKLFRAKKLLAEKLKL